MDSCVAQALRRLKYPEPIDLEVSLRGGPGMVPADSWRQGDDYFGHVDIEGRPDVRPNHWKDKGLGAMLAPGRIKR